MRSRCWRLWLWYWWWDTSDAAGWSSFNQGLAVDWCGWCGLAGEANADWPEARSPMLCWRLREVPAGSPGEGPDMIAGVVDVCREKADLAGEVEEESKMPAGNSIFFANCSFRPRVVINAQMSANLDMEPNATWGGARSCWGLRRGIPGCTWTWVDGPAGNCQGSSGERWDSCQRFQKTWPDP